MIVGGKHYRALWVKDGSDNRIVQVIDQKLLPFKFEIIDLKSVEDIINAIKDMTVRGAPLIGITAAYGVYFGALEALDQNINTKEIDRYLHGVGESLKAARPTAVNLAWAVDEQLGAVRGKSNIDKVIEALLDGANYITDMEANNCRSIGEAGVSLIEEISGNKNGDAVNILTHCNAGWPACIDYGTATAPIYEAFERGIKVHVWVDETRPRGQGSRITAWELKEHGVPHTVIADNTGGHLMQHGMVDIVLVGSDRVTCTGDVANKIGTYLKALAAFDNNVPFYVAIPASTIDWKIRDGIHEIPIEQRGDEEIKYMEGLDLDQGEIRRVLVTPKESPVCNYGFDVTPSRLVSGLITERGICKSTEEEILSLFPEKKN